MNVKSENRNRQIGGEALNIVIYDTDMRKRNLILQYVKMIRPKDTITSYKDTDQLMKYVETHQTEIAFINVNGAGYFLAEDLLKTYRNMDVIYLAKNGEYALRALQLHATDYIVDGYTKETIEDTLNHLKFH